MLSGKPARSRPAARGGAHAAAAVDLSRRPALDLPRGPDRDVLREIEPFRVPAQLAERARDLTRSESSSAYESFPSSGARVTPRRVLEHW